MIPEKRGAKVQSLETTALRKISLKLGLAFSGEEYERRRRIDFLQFESIKEFERATMTRIGHC